MSATAATPQGTAGIQGELWSARPRDWAELQEPQCRALFEHALERAGVGPGTRHLDVGCGAGLAAQLAALRGARVSGLDAAEMLLAIARERTATGDFRGGEMEALPFDAATFDVVTGFNAFQYAASPPRALAEARRVCRSGGSVVIATWGEPGDCEAAGYIKALGSMLPPPPPGAPGPFALSERDRLTALATEAGLFPVGVEDVECIWSYADIDTALRGMLSAGPAIRAIRHAGEDAVRAAVLQALASHRDANGSYRLRNVFRYVLARA